MIKMEAIVRLNESNLKIALEGELSKMGYTPQNRDGFLYASGNYPVMLVAHLDTVHKSPVTHICKTSDGMIWMSPQGIGGDDRCGVWMVLNTIKESKVKPYVLFTEQEEVGGIGATKFCKSELTPNINYIIEFDRTGKDDAVFYNCDNPKFTEFITSFGFQEESGSFSDISIIAPHLGVSAVNLSSGYFNAHTTSEYFDLRVMKENVAKAVRIINSNQTQPFEYIQCKSNYGYYSDWYNFDYSDEWDDCEYIEGYIVHPEMVLVDINENEITAGKVDTTLIIDDWGNLYQTEGYTVYDCEVVSPAPYWAVDTKQNQYDKVSDFYILSTHQM